MTRKTKIQFAAGFIVLALIAWAVWPGEDEGEVRVIFAGASLKDTNAIVFVLTNSRQSPVEYFLDVLVQTNGVWPDADGSVPPPRGEILGSSTFTIEQSIASTQHWRVNLEYTHSFEPSLAGGIRERLSGFAFSHGWKHLSSWFYPDMRLKFAPGPEMLGNHPVAAAQK